VCATEGYGLSWMAPMSAQATHIVD